MEPFFLVQLRSAREQYWAKMGKNARQPGWEGWLKSKKGRQTGRSARERFRGVAVAGRRGEVLVAGTGLQGGA